MSFAFKKACRDMEEKVEKGVGVQGAQELKLNGRQMSTIPTRFSRRLLSLLLLSQRLAVSRMREVLQILVTLPCQADRCCSYSSFQQYAGCLHAQSRTPCSAMQNFCSFVALLSLHEICCCMQADDNDAYISTVNPLAHMTTPEPPPGMTS